MTPRSPEQVVGRGPGTESEIVAALFAMCAAVHALIAVTDWTGPVCASCTLRIPVTIVAAAGLAWASAWRLWTRGRQGAALLVAGSCAAAHLGVVLASPWAACAGCFLALGLELVAVSVALPTLVGIHPWLARRAALACASACSSTVAIGLAGIAAWRDEPRAADRPASLAATSHDGTTLMIVESPGCPWCELLRADIASRPADDLPEDVSIAFLDASTPQGRAVVRRHGIGEFPSIVASRNGVDRMESGLGALDRVLAFMHGSGGRR